MEKIYKYLKLIIVAVLIVCFSSCAIHKKFPFICFRFECIKAQLKFPGLKANIKRNRAEAAAKKRKRNGASNKESARIKDITKPTVDRTGDENPPADTRKDSVFTLSAPVIVPKAENQDTLIIYNFDLYEDIICYEQKTELKKYILRVGSQKISQIKIKGYSDASENRGHSGMDLLRAKKIYKLFLVLIFYLFN